MVLQLCYRSLDNFYMCIRSFMKGLAKKGTSGFGDWIQNSKMTSFEVFLVIPCSWCFQGLSMRRICGKWLVYVIQKLLKVKGQEMHEQI